MTAGHVRDLLEIWLLDVAFEVGLTRPDWASYS